MHLFWTFALDLTFGVKGEHESGVTDRCKAAGDIFYILEAFWAVVRSMKSVDIPEEAVAKFSDSAWDLELFNCCSCSDVKTCTLACAIGNLGSVFLFVLSTALLQTQEYVSLAVAFKAVHSTSACMCAYRCCSRLSALLARGFTHATRCLNEGFSGYISGIPTSKFVRSHVRGFLCHLENAILQPNPSIMHCI